MKNKRNTRRGRAKRWYWLTECAGAPVYVLRGTHVEVWHGYWHGPWWVANTDDAFTMSKMHKSRAAAMRAAEHLARRR